MDKIQERALRTWYEESHCLYHDMMPATLGLMGEAGEFADLVKKNVYKPGVAIAADQFLDELGDVLFYLAVLANYFGVTMDELSQRNSCKLAERENNGTGYNRGEDRL